MLGAAGTSVRLLAVTAARVVSFPSIKAGLPVRLSVSGAIRSAFVCSRLNAGHRALAGVCF